MDQGIINTLASQYQQAAARTLIDKPTRPLTDNEIMIVWNGIGLAGEAGELLASIYGGLTNADISKEIGDQFWYIAALCTKAGIDLADIMALRDNRPPALTFPDDIRSQAILGAWHVVEVSAVSEYIKKAILHGHGFDPDTLAALLSNVIYVLLQVIAAFGLSLDQVWSENINKLWVRFPGGFSSQASIDRVDNKGVNCD